VETVFKDTQLWDLVAVLPTGEKARELAESCRKLAAVLDMLATLPDQTIEDHKRAMLARKLKGATTSRPTTGRSTNP
jgi:hypothetical protein